MPDIQSDFAKRIESLDLSLFDHILTQSDDGDRRAWLAVQRSVRKPTGYTYLEIGSHLGGSLQQHWVDPLCRNIISIDKRPIDMPDDRGKKVHYEGNSTARMLSNLRRISANSASTLTCFDNDASKIDPSQITAPPDYCFIDGEHTRSAVLSDFEFCLRVCAPDAAICFHDDIVIYPAIAAILSRLRKQGVPFTAGKLTGFTFGIFLRNCSAAHDPYILSHAHEGAGWVRRQRIRRMVPVALHPAASWVADLFRR